MNYYLKVGDWYLSDVNYDIDNEGNLIVIDYTIGKEYRKGFAYFEAAEDMRKHIFIETGLNLVIKKFKDKKEEE